MDRRQLLARLPLIGVAAAAPVAAADMFSNPLERAEHYAHKLAEAMHDIPHAMEVTVHSGDRDQDMNFRLIGPGTGRIRREELTRRLMSEAEHADPTIEAWHVWTPSAAQPNQRQRLRLQISAISDLDQSVSWNDHMGGLFPAADFKRGWAK
ncbi:hypothetical protein [Devosia naphthalenivorans]|uniref:hypothetical protein n=1 Tax=Devosia naphthalenivorans TaxID=2082392 RepID=UPI000D37CAD3|nr:hypothetical protein [Devosia naphthalenivorans]